MPSNLTFEVVYVLGVAIGVMVMRDPWPARIGTALVWPLGPIAFVLVVSLLLVVAAILWPLLMLAAAALGAGLVWLL
jgi:hypothetical protein